MKKLFDNMFTVNLCRLILALTFIFSGYVKAVDPLGTQYKIGDYLEALNMSALMSPTVALVLSVLLAALEFCIGIFLLFAIYRRLSSRIALVLMIVMTPITLWLALANPVKDCGCFGDAVVLTNWQTFLKNVVLLACAVVLAKWPLRMVRFISKTNQGIVINFTALFILLTSVWCLYDLPIFDFRPYHIGANIPKGMEMPEDAKQPVFETTFIMEKDGERKTFTLADYPDSTWTFIDSKTVQVEEGYVPPIHDFSIQEAETGEDITDQVLQYKGYTFLLISPHLEDASDSNFADIDQLHEYCQQHNYPFYCLTASSDDAIQHWRDITGAEYKFCITDETTLKTIIRSNPGLLLLKKGTIIRKWSHNNYPQIEQANTQLPLERLSIGQMPTDSVPGKILTIVLLFVLPLFLLTLADRLWAWTKWIKRRRWLRNQEKKEAEEETSEGAHEGEKDVENEKENEVQPT
ncbi:MAG: DoxX family protein [Prevotella sp.]|nr:DoxX family protein [Prevotella sp.]